MLALSALGKDRLIREQGPDTAHMGIIIKDDIWLGAGVAVMPGITIETGAVVGANSVVTQSIPEYDIWAGCPARKIGER
jgi:acetyltransferase-like isoleucine patch superfamily enzyme